MIIFFVEMYSISHDCFSKVYYTHLVMLGQDYCLNSGQDSMKSWAGIEEGKAGRSVSCVMQSVRVLVMCCGIVLHTLVLEVPSCWS